MQNEPQQQQNCISFYCCVCISLDLSNRFMLLAPGYIHTFILKMFPFFLIVEYIYLYSNFKTSMTG